MTLAKSESLEDNSSRLQQRKLSTSVRLAVPQFVFAEQQAYFASLLLSKVKDPFVQQMGLLQVCPDGGLRSGSPSG